MEGLYRLMLLNWCSPIPPLRVIVISKVRLAEMAPPTRDMVITDMFSIWTYVAGLGTNMKLLSKQNSSPSFALMEHLTPECPWWLYFGSVTFDLRRPLGDWVSWEFGPGFLLRYSERD